MNVVVPLPFPKPPMMANDRYPHWAVKAKAVRAVRAATASAVLRVAKGSHMAEPVEVELIWTVTDKRRRDSDGPEPTKKACLDGLVDAGLISDDKSSVVVRSFCSIELGTTPGVRLVVRDAREGVQPGRDATNGIKSAESVSDQENGSTTPGGAA